MTAARTIGLGCMRLSTDADRDDERSIAVIRAALEAGATLLDTAPTYCLDDQIQAAQAIARIASVRVPRAERRPREGADGEVVIVMGMPGAGKSALARELAASGYHRLNRDAAGGRMAAREDPNAVLRRCYDSSRPNPLVVMNVLIQAAC